MKILITTDWYEPVINGVVTSVLTLKKELELLGHEVRVATLSEDGRERREGGVYYLRSVNAGKIYPGARAVCPSGKKYARQLLEWKPDVVHSQCEFSSFLIARKIASQLQIPLVHTYHTVYEDYTHYFKAGKPWGRQAAAAFSRYILEKTDRVIVPTGKVKTLLRGYGVDRSIDVIPTGIRTQLFLPDCWQQVQQERTLIREKFGIGEDKLLLVALGRLAREKNLEEVIRYFGRLEREDMELLIVGDGPWRRELEELARMQEGGERIHFAGMVPPEKTPEFYHAGDLFVCASQSETQGITYLEALCAGLPVLCRKDACVDGIVKNGENGWQYESWEEFRDCCLELAGDRTERNFLSSQAVRTGLENGSARFAERVLKVYEQAIQETGGEEETGKTVRVLHLPRRTWDGLAAAGIHSACRRP